MKYIDVLRALGALVPHAIGGIDLDLNKIGDDCNREVHDEQSLVLALFEERAGFVAAEACKNAEYRLGNPRLLTTLPGERMKSLESRRLKYGDEVGKMLPRVMETIIKLSLVETELANERHRSDQNWNAGRRREALGIYDQVVTAIDMLHNGYEVTRWHWASASDEQLRDIAAILLRKDRDQLLVLDRDRLAGCSDA